MSCYGSKQLYKLFAVLYFFEALRRVWHFIKFWLLSFRRIKDPIIEIVISYCEGQLVLVLLHLQALNVLNVMLWLCILFGGLRAGKQCNARSYGKSSLHMSKVYCICICCLAGQTTRKSISFVKNRLCQSISIPWTTESPPITLHNILAELIWRVHWFSKLYSIIL